MSIVVSDSATEATLQAYAHPLSIQAKAISELENKVLNGDVVADGNNVFTYLTEFSSNMVADLVNKACMCFNSLYPENAQTSTDLYKHLSDFDYIGLFATPAEMTVELVFDRNYLIDNALDYQGKYYKIIIPEYSKFTIGEYTFGLMYPIEIRIRKAPNLPNGQVDYDNSIITVMWDTTNENPLKTLESHILEHRDFVQEGQTLTAIQVPIYQFEVANHVENAIASTGFAKRYDYTNMFYAIRVFHFKNGKWNEMAQTLSDINYDVDKPTAMIKVLMDIAKVEVVIPQIYFNSTDSNAVIGNRILVKIYTTVGELNLDLNGYSIEQYQASFLMTDTILVEDDTYSNMLKRIPTIYLLPAASRISSGTDGIDMESLRERVKHSASYMVKITPDDLDAYFSSSGFTFTRELDNITDRVFCAHKVLTDSSGTTIAAGEGKAVFTPEMLNIQFNEETNKYYVPNYSSISALDPTMITIQPSAVYKYDKESNTFSMVSDEDLEIFWNQTEQKVVDSLNNTLYTYNPFHIRMSLDDDLPIAGSYDMFNPSLKSIVFEWENQNTTAEISIYTAQIKSLNTEDSGYRLSVALFKTANLADVEPIVDDGLQIKNIQVMLSTTNSEGAYLYMLGTYNGKDSTGHDVFIFDIKSAFTITKTGMFDVLNMYDITGNSDSNFLDMDEHTYQISFFVKDDMMPEEDTYPMEGVDLTGIPGELDGYTYLCRQAFKLTLGQSLPLLKNNMTIGTSDEKYATYPTTQFDTYLSPIYARWTVQDYLDKVTDPMTNEPVIVTKIGTLKFGKFELTTDEVAQANKTYYSYNEETKKYTKLTLNPGAAIPEDTYEVIRTAIVAHSQGDVIISSPYGFNYGPVVNMQVDKDINALTLLPPYTASSNLSNVWNSISGNIFITGAKYTAFTGMYSVVDPSAEVTKKVWKQSCISKVEIYDTTSINVSAGTTIRLYKYRDDSGNIVISEYAPEKKEYTTIDLDLGGEYNSSNSEIVKSDEYVSSNKNNTINTKARGLNRRWFLYNSTTANKFDFAKNEGMVIEYTADGTANEGISKSWCLNYYYASTDSSGLRCTNVITVIKNLKSDSVLCISATDKEKLDVDAYVGMYQTVYHFIHWISDIAHGCNGWLLGETTAENMAGLEYYYYGPVVNDDSIRMPWEVEWQPLKLGDASELSVICMNNTDAEYRASIIDALNYILNFISYEDVYGNVHYKSYKESDLYKHIDEGVLTSDLKFLVDKEYYTRYETGSLIRPYGYTLATVAPGTDVPSNMYYEKRDPYVSAITTLFAYTDTCEDQREQEYCNSKINYAPIGDDGKQIADPEFPSTRFIEVGTTNPGGAIYYLDLEAEAFDYESYNLTQEQVVNVIQIWDKYKVYSENVRYKYITDQTGIALFIVKKIVSSTDPCYFFPWKKLVNVSSAKALKYYYDHRKIVNCEITNLSNIQNALNTNTYKTYESMEAAMTGSSTDPNIIAFVKDITDIDDKETVKQWLGLEPDQKMVDWAANSLLGYTNSPTSAFIQWIKNKTTGAVETAIGVRCGYDEESCKKNILSYGTYSGYMYLIQQKMGESTYADKYLNCASKIERTYTGEEETFTRKEFNINFETSIWTEIDKWIWELEDPWVTTAATISNLVIAYNADVSCAKALHLNTDVMINEDGDPIVATNGGRSEQYIVDMIHCDYKLVKASDAYYKDYANDIRGLLRSYFNELNTISPSLLARTKIYFAPIRTLGQANFKGNSGTEVTLPLEFSIGLGLHVESYVNGSELNKETIKNSILSLVDKRLKEGYLNLALLAKDVMTDLSDNIICVDVLGINGDNSLQTMIPVDPDTYPQLQQVLVINDDGSVHATRRLDITWYVID